MHMAAGRPLAAILHAAMDSPTISDGGRVFQHALCVYPYRQDLKKSRFVPPLGIEYIARVVAPHARRLDVVDLRHAGGRTRDFLRPETDLICFSINWGRNLDFVRREILSVPSSIFTVAGGRYATEDPERWLTDCPNLDAVVRGDGEETMAELCATQSLASIAGISFRNGNGLCHNPARKLGPVSDAIYPDRRRRRHVYHIAVRNVRTTVAFDAVSGSRGCPYNCKFCSFSRNPYGEKRSWSARSPESIVDELAEIEAPFVGFTDEIFTHDAARVERICDLIIARGIRKKYVINARLEIARHPQVLRKMEQAGFAMLLLGIESAQDKTLLSMRKGFDTARIREYMAVLRDRPMILHGYFILGNIGESVAEMRQMVPFAHALGLDTIVFSMLRNTPYSAIEALVAQTPGYRLAPNGKVYSDQCSLDDLKQLRRTLYRQFYNRRQALRFLSKARRSGLLKLFVARSPVSTLKFAGALLKS